AVLLQQPASAWTPIYSEALNAARAVNPAQPLSRLRWYAGLIATPGILGRKLNRSERYKLSRWPETEREYPRHFRLAKEMVKDYATVDEIVAASGMTYEEVIDYMNASFADGRLEAAPKPEVGDAAPRTSRRERLIEKRRGVFRAAFSFHVDRDLPGDDGRIERHMVRVAQFKLQRVRAGREVQHRFGLAATEMPVAVVVRNRQARRRQRRHVDQQVVMTGVFL